MWSVRLTAILLRGITFEVSGPQRRHSRKEEGKTRPAVVGPLDRRVRALSGDTHAHDLCVGFLGCQHTAPILMEERQDFETR
jgi:hypothetical protein